MQEESWGTAVYNSSTTNGEDVLLGRRDYGHKLRAKMIALDDRLLFKMWLPSSLHFEKEWVALSE